MHPFQLWKAAPWQKVSAMVTFNEAYVNGYVKMHYAAWLTPKEHMHMLADVLDAACS